MPGFGGSFLDHLITAMQEKNKFLYMIRSRNENGEWYFFDMENDKPPYRIAWVPYISPAFKFPSEESVEEFRADYIAPRKVEIVRMEIQL